MKYDAIVTRTGTTWLAEVPQLGGAVATASNLDELAENLRRTVSSAKGLAEGEAVRIELITVPPEPDRGCGYRDRRQP